MENLGLFEKYLDGSLSENEKAIFKTRLQTDIAFANEYQMYLEIHQALRLSNERKSFTDSLKNVSDIYFNDKNKGNNNSIFNPKFLFIAASIAVLITLSIATYLYLNTSISNEKLYSLNYVPIKADFASRSLYSTENEINKILDLYQKQNYIEFIVQISQTKVNDSLSAMVSLLKAVSYMQLELFENAETTLLEAINDKNNLLYDDCLWYLSLIYLKLENNILTKKYLSMLVENESFYKDKAKELLNKL